jgi:sterol desaturase/sphingolipid hydroxylase (fatty acid hydroxylase superfamily)
VFLATVVALTALGQLLAFRVLALQCTRELNREADRVKLFRKRYSEAVRQNNRAALLVNAGFYVAILPFCLSLEPRPLWRHALDTVAVLMVFDFFYYVTHRFLFHGSIPLIAALTGGPLNAFSMAVATLTMVYDRLFGTFEAPVVRQTP